MNTATLVLDCISTFAFALVGAQMAIRKEMDIAGILFVSSVSALSGGTFRNLSLGVNPAWIHQPYLLVAVLCGILVAIAFRNRKSLRGFSIFFDSIGLGFATIAGVNLSLHLHAQFLAAIVLGVLSGVLGGLVRDVLCQVPPVLLHRETNGASAFFGALIFAILVREKVNQSVAELSCLAIIVLLRLLSIKFKINLPRFSK
jgi:uncharacterized membrane protein YeiH